MKRIVLLTTLAVCAIAFVGCTDTKDCSCMVEVSSKTAIQKAASAKIVSDWDTDCDKITAEDVPGWNGDPCTEI